MQVADRVTAAPRKSVVKRLVALLENEQLLGYLVIAPALLLLLVLVAYPFFMAIGLSVHDKVVGKPGVFVGLGNFWTLLDSQIFRQTLQNSFVFTICSVGLKIVMGMGLALLLNRSIRAQQFWRGAILLPWVVPTALSTLAFLWIFDATYSIINWILRDLGLIDQAVPGDDGRDLREYLARHALFRHFHPGRAGVHPPGTLRGSQNRRGGTAGPVLVCNVAPVEASAHGGHSVFNDFHL